MATIVAKLTLMKAVQILPVIKQLIYFFKINPIEPAHRGGFFIARRKLNGN